MRVLAVIDSLAPGGAERSLAAVASAYARLGVELTVAYLNDRPGLHAELTGAGAQLRSVDGPGGRTGRFRRLLRLVRAERPDLVHTTLAESDLLGRVSARLAGVPVVSTLANEAYGPEQLDAPGLSTVKLRTVQALDAGTARLTRRLHAVSAAVADTMAQRLRVSRARIDVIPRGRDPEVLGVRSPERSRRVRDSLGVGERPLVLAVARQEHQKGLDVLIRAMAAVVACHPGAVALVAGRPGAATPSLKRQVAAAGLSAAVRLLGPRDDVPDLLAAADVFVAPSRWEGMPGAVIEAMALEVPIVASDIRPVREAVGGEDVAILVPSEDTHALSAGIQRCLGAPDAAASRARAGHARFDQHFHSEAVARAMVRFYDRALGSRRE